LIFSLACWNFSYRTPIPFWIQYLAFVLINLAIVFVGAQIVLRFSEKPGYVLKEHMSNYHRNKTSRDRVNNIRSNLNCCGINAFHHLDDLNAEIGNKTLSTSCCIPQNKKGCDDLLEGRHIEIKKWEEINEIIYTEVGSWNLTSSWIPNNFSF
jgi:hypothetical protein